MFYKLLIHLQELATIHSNLSFAFFLIKKSCQSGADDDNDEEEKEKTFEVNILN